MKAGKNPDMYRVTPWDHRKGGDYRHHPEVIEGAEGGTVPFPRHVKDADGNTHHVKDEDHEATILGLPSAESVPAEEPQPVSADGDPVLPPSDAENAGNVPAALGEAPAPVVDDAA